MKIGSNSQKDKNLVAFIKKFSWSWDYFTSFAAFSMI